MNKWHLNTIRAIFFISGFAALIYQIAWQRMLFTAFGVDLESITVIIAVFMAGLGIGAYFGGRLADKFPQKIILLFALTEVGIGVFGFFSPILIDLTKLTFLHSSGVVVAVSNFILLLFPTFLMGSTLPLLTKYLNEYIDNIGNNIGWLYFVNTLGASSACIITGFMLFNHLELDQVIYLAATLNCFVAFIVFILYRNTKKGSIVVSNELSHFKVDNRIVKKAILLSFLGGFLSLGLEVIWIRLFSLYSSSIPQAFSLILALFLLGISFGSLIGKKVCQEGKANLDYVGKIFLLSALLDVVAILALIYFTSLFVFIFSVVLLALLRGIIFP
ncbi:MAG: fused MFS/spermidine synthase, partial [Flavobacteriaceae bacterium]|nr:fused MFS/spermidine synthase [Flavobacteriaceae bacterium]